MQMQSQELQAQLEQHGKANGAPVFVGERILTYVTQIGLNEELKDLRFFHAAGEIENFATDTFPANETAYDVRGISLSHNLQFKATITPDAGVALATQQFFEQSSILTIKHREREHTFRAPFSLLTPWTVATSGVGWTIMRKTNTYFRFHTPLAVGSLQKFEIRSKHSPGFVTNATYAAATTPILPGTGLASNQGYFIAVNLHVGIYNEVS